MSVKCKQCESRKTLKNGFSNGKQRYKCKARRFTFVKGDARTNEKIAATKAMSVVIYSLGKGSYNMLGKLFGRNRSLIYRWIQEAGINADEPVVDDKITEIEFDEVWRFIERKAKNFGLSEPLTVAAGELSPGFSVIVIAQRSEGSATKSSI